MTVFPVSPAPRLQPPRGSAPRRGTHQGAGASPQDRSRCTVVRNPGCRTCVPLNLHCDFRRPQAMPEDFHDPVAPVMRFTCRDGRKPGNPERINRIQIASPDRRFGTCSNTSACRPPSLCNDYHRPTFEQSGRRTDMLAFEALGRKPLARLDRRPDECDKDGVEVNALVEPEPIDLIAVRPSMPVQVAEHLDRALAARSLMGRKPSTADVAAATPGKSLRQSRASADSSALLGEGVRGAVPRRTSRHHHIPRRYSRRGPHPTARRPLVRRGTAAVPLIARSQQL